MHKWKQRFGQCPQYCATRELSVGHNPYLNMTHFILTVLPQIAYITIAVIIVVIVSILWLRKQRLRVTCLSMLPHPPPLPSP